MNDISPPHLIPEPYASQYPDNDYLAALAFVDAQVGRILDEIQHLGIAERTLVVLASTYGEGLGTHFEGTHSWSLYDENTRVALMFSLPGRIPAGRKIDAQVRLIDTVPTLLNLLAMEPKSDSHGVSLVPLIDGTAADVNLAAYSETLVPYLELSFYPPRSLRKAGWKYIHTTKPELYNLADDPTEKNNLADEQPDRVSEMRDEIFTLLTGSPVLPEVPEASLESPINADGSVDDIALLQYTGSDVKDNVEIITGYESALLSLAYDDHERALSYIVNVVLLNPDLVRPVNLAINLMVALRKAEEVIPWLEKFVEAKPDRHDVRYRLAEVYEKDGQVDKALDAFLQCEASMPPDSPPAKALNQQLADLLYKMQRYEEAEARLRTSILEQPNNPQLRLALVALLTDAGALDRAAEEFRKRMPKDNPEAASLEDHQVHDVIANLLASKGYKAQALAHRRKQVELKPDLPEARVKLGMLLQEMENSDEAAKVFEAAHAQWPENGNVLFNLALLYKRMGRYQESVDLLRAGLTKDPKSDPGRLGALCLLSLILATCPDDNVRSGAEALKLAQEACDMTNQEGPLALQSLAAAWAEVGDFTKAQEAAAKAQSEAAAGGLQQLAGTLQFVNMAFYKQGKPYREKRPQQPGEEPSEEPAGGAPQPEPDAQPAGGAPEGGGI